MQMQHRTLAAYPGGPICPPVDHSSSAANTWKSPNKANEPPTGGSFRRSGARLMLVLPAIALGWFHDVVTTQAVSRANPDRSADVNLLQFQSGRYGPYATSRTTSGALVFASNLFAAISPERMSLVHLLATRASELPRACVSAVS